MFKILIVDDEEIERESMKQILNQAFESLTIIQASDGQEAVERTLSDQPDLVLMDIKMPGMSGLEAIKAIQAQGIKMNVVIVTAYDTFSFAKDAIKLGARDYLLKPSKISEIVETMGRIIDEIKETKLKMEESEKRRLTFEQSKRVMERDLVTQVLLDHVHDVEAEHLLELMEREVTEEMFCFVVVIEAHQSDVYPVLQNAIARLGDGFIGPLYRHQLPVICFRDERSYRQQATEVAKKLIKVLQHELKLPAVIGLGQPSTKLEEMKDSYQQAIIASMELRRTYAFSFYDDMKMSEHQCDIHYHTYLSGRFFDDIREADFREIKQQVDKILLCYEMEKFPVAEAKQKISQLIWMMGKTLEEVHISIEWEKYSFFATDYQALFEEVDVYFKELIANYNAFTEDKETDRMTQIKQYVMEHATEDLSLDVLASHVHLSPIYISKLFKEKLGVNYIEFLTTCRIKHAKRLLKADQLSIKEVAYEIGYHDPNYFSKVFKKFTGFSPKTYRAHRLVEQQ
ncbi:two-component system response regulator YesN [Streptohalobacillus salinus]|uniref:Two-component system response regulator YesN n=1 Tax=Streptohalobacillus salinus TaxID=621096 RepID=A0A2V3WE67_9BACI|nr:response regulator [Streptohalobacillus salinus]PXW93180.1 two-component system response regulator YesN [Streptohalobacillus salinus]